MNPINAQVDALLARVNRLERQNRLWQGIVLLSLVSTGTVVVFSTPRAQAEGRADNEVSANKVVVTDENGKAVLTGSGLQFVDRKTGKPRASVGSGGLFIYNKEGTLQAALYCSSDHALLHLWGEQFQKGKKAQVILRVNDEKGALLQLLDHDGDTVFKKP